MTEEGRNPKSNVLLNFQLFKLTSGNIGDNHIFFLGLTPMISLGKFHLVFVLEDRLLKFAKTEIKLTFRPSN
jgi:hypothetical protein